MGIAPPTYDQHAGSGHHVEQPDNTSSGRFPFEHVEPNSFFAACMDDHGYVYSNLILSRISALGISLYDQGTWLREALLGLQLSYPSQDVEYQVSAPLIAFESAGEDRDGFAEESFAEPAQIKGGRHRAGKHAIAVEVLAAAVTNPEILAGFFGDDLLIDDGVTRDLDPDSQVAAVEALITEEPITEEETLGHIETLLIRSFFSCGDIPTCALVFAKLLPMYSGFRRFVLRESNAQVNLPNTSRDSPRTGQTASVSKHLPDQNPPNNWGDVDEAANHIIGLIRASVSPDASATIHPPAHVGHLRSDDPQVTNPPTPRETQREEELVRLDQLIGALVAMELLAPGSGTQV